MKLIEKQVKKHIILQLFFTTRIMKGRLNDDLSREINKETHNEHSNETSNEQSRDEDNFINTNLNSTPNPARLYETKRERDENLNREHNGTR